MALTELLRPNWEQHESTFTTSTFQSAWPENRKKSKPMSEKSAKELVIFPEPLDLLNPVQEIMASPAETLIIPHRAFINKTNST